MKKSEWDKIEKCIQNYQNSFINDDKSYEEIKYLREQIGYLKGKCEAYERILIKHKLIAEKLPFPKPPKIVIDKKCK